MKTYTVTTKNGDRFDHDGKWLETRDGHLYVSTWVYSHADGKKDITPVASYAPGEWLYVMLKRDNDPR